MFKEVESSTERRTAKRLSAKCLVQETAEKQPKSHLPDEESAIWIIPTLRKEKSFATGTTTQ